MNEESRGYLEYESERDYHATQISYWDEKFEAERVTDRCVIMKK